MCKVTSFPDNTQQNTRFFLEKGKTFFTTPHFHLPLKKGDDNKNKKNDTFILYCTRIIVTLSPIYT